MASVADIPIQNIYYLLCYAWDKLDEQDVVAVDGIDSNQIQDLLGKVLANGMAHLLRRGLHRDYLVHNEDTGHIRGKIMFPATIKRNLMTQAKVNCEYDDLSHNVIHNQVLKASLRLLIMCEDLDTKVRDELLLNYRRMHGIDDIELRNRHFDQIQLNRNNSFYDFLLKICELVYNNLQISEETGHSKFRDFFRDERKMAYLFEAFVRNFYARELKSNYRVKREDIYWDMKALDTASESYLPKMQTDISLIKPGHKIIMDTKYYKQALQSYYDKESIRSANLYQLHAYVTNIESRGGDNLNCEGMLLYPTVEEDIHARFDMRGHRITVASINLNQDWQGIHRDLVELIAN
jgi:5-methylcytosine-specific restriction enzyme subunit McrC